MTKLFEEGIKAVRALPPERQDMAGELLLGLAGVAHPDYQLTPEQIEDVKLAITQADRGEFATDNQVAATWKKFGYEAAVYAAGHPASPSNRRIHFTAQSRRGTASRRAHPRSDRPPSNIPAYRSCRALSGTRELIVPSLPYIIVYRLEHREENTLVILGIYHAAQLRPGLNEPSSVFSSA